MNYKIKLSLLVAIVFALFSCRKDSDTFTQTIEIPDPIIIIETDVDGLVTDQNDQAIEGAIIWMGQAFNETDQNGYFQISGDGNADGTYLRIEKEGYFDGYGVITPSSIGQAHVRFTLIEKNPIETYHSSENKVVQLENSSIALKANSYQYEDGSLYEGDVTIYSTYIDPTLANFQAVMPGDLIAIGEDQEVVELRSFGMLHVELFDDQNKPLQINKAATIQVEIPESLRNDAPSDIPLWYFDEQTGIWIEEGFATDQGGYYEGEVDHFTLWNCDIPFPFVNYKGQIETPASEHESLLNNLRVKMTWVENESYATTYTDSQGNFGGKVPANAALIIEVLDHCNRVILSDNIGPFSMDTEETFTIDLNSNIRNVSGVAVNCDGEPIVDGYVTIRSTGGIFPIVISLDGTGNFEQSIHFCEDVTYTYQVVDLIDLQQSDMVELDIQSESINLGTIAACDQAIESSVSFSWNNQDFVFPATINYRNSLSPQDTTLVDFWEINFIDEYENGNTIYKISVIIWNPQESPDESLIGFSIEFDIILDTGDQPERSLIFEGDLNLIAQGKSVGEYVEFTIDPVTILDWSTGDVAEGGILIMKGIIQ